MSDVMVADAICQRGGCGRVRRKLLSDSWPRYKARKYCSSRCGSATRAWKPKKCKRKECDGMTSSRKAKFCKPSCAALHRHDQNRDHLLSELGFLIGTDSSESLATRLGFSGLDPLLRRLYNNGRLDLIERLNRFAYTTHDERLEAVA